MLFTERDKQLKEKTKEKVSPFNAAVVRKKKAEKEAKVVEQKWAPKNPTSRSMLPSSTASVCAKKGSARLSG